LIGIPLLYKSGIELYYSLTLVLAYIIILALGRPLPIDALWTVVNAFRMS